MSFRNVVEWHRNGMDNVELKDLPLEKIIKIPLTKRIDDLMEVFQKSRKHIALVLDEHGGVVGVVTMEDVIEEVFGDIKDEKDDEEVYIRHISDGSISVVGNTLIEDILEECEINEIEEIGFREEHYGEAISYLIIERLERFPREGEILKF
ncbi:CBS domain-containing protein [Candidatus Peregrinibacteria bacterium]|nr:CBS domain-containing protein [Candidatus Peregrinibacteria bacterium]MCB9804936.1 CBS domain-containing protein [Candidatus Peribacteria bacterium]